MIKNTAPGSPKTQGLSKEIYCKNVIMLGGKLFSTSPFLSPNSICTVSTPLFPRKVAHIDAERQGKYTFVRGQGNGSTVLSIASTAKVIQA